MPLLAAGHFVDWWFVFKFNAASFPGCARGAARTCWFGGQMQSSWRSLSQQFAVASSETKSLQAGSGCVGDTIDDPVGATFDEIYDGSFNYVVWNDQFYQDPQLAACGSSNSCGAPWGTF
jgi:Deoxyribonuclease II